MNLTLAFISVSPLVKDLILEREDNLDLPRNTIDEVISYLDEELTGTSTWVPFAAIGLAWAKNIFACLISL